jgi:uncharacterized protein (DUF433 family)
MDTTSKPYKYLARKPKSVYKQLFIKDRWISARTLYGKFMSEESPMTPEEIAADYELPLEAVLEAIAYCASKPPEIASDHAAEEALMEATGMNDPDYKYHPQPKVLSSEERRRLLPGRSRLARSGWHCVALGGTRIERQSGPACECVTS